MENQMFSIFQFVSYKAALQAQIQSMPKKGHGQLRKIADRLRVNSVVMSQVLRGDRNLTHEQAVEVAGYFGWGEFETEYFLLLVSQERAGTEKLKRVLGKRISEIASKATRLSERLPQDKALDDAAKAIFYSSWRHSAARLLSSLDGFQSTEAIADRLGLSLGAAARIVDFLVENGLCVRGETGLRMGPSRTHLPADSPYVARHHANWRVKALGRLDSATEADLFFTGPMTISRAAAAELREALVTTIRRASDLASSSNAERTACLNVDWFDF